MNYEETHTTVYKFRSMDRRKNNGGLREPLYPPPPGSPDFDPAFIDKDLVDMKREKTQYLPPYRYSSDEKVRNVYRSSDEAYCTVAKNLLLHFECGKNIHDAHEIVKTNLTPTQRKFFADAHMEKAMHIPAQLVEGEPNHFAIVRRCDLVFGVVLLEYYASSDGNLFAAQIESIDRALAKLNNAIPYMGEEQKGQENLDDRHVDIHEEEQNELDVKDSNEISDSSGENIAEESRPEKLSQEINTYSEDSTFDKIYHEGTNSNVDEESSAKGEDATVKTASTETHLKHSMLRQELLKEITQISQLLWSTNDKDQIELYEDYLDTLRQRFNDYADKKATDGYVMKTTLQSLQNNNRVNTDDQTPIPSKQGIPESSYMANISLNSQIVDDVDEHFIRVSTVDQFPITVVDRTPDKDNLIATEVSYKVPDIQHAEGTNDVYERGLKHQSSKLRRVSELESGLKNIQLVAPIAMKEGFTFIAKYRKKKFLARIPRGGVKKNQTFVTPMLKPTSTSRQFVCYETQLESMNIPKGRWRDGLFNCLKDPLLLLALFFPLVVLSQISSRIEFIETGHVKSSYGVRFLLFLTVAVVSVNAWTAIALFVIIGNPSLWLILVCGIPVAILDLLMIVSLILKTVRTRRQVKKLFDIEEGSAQDLAKDIAVSLFCSCCTISQMGRHTADYSTFREQTFTSTGLPNKLQKLIPVHTFKE